MKICMLTSSYPQNPQDGAGSFVGSAARAIVAMGHEVHVVAPYIPGISSSTDRGVHIHRFKYAPFDKWCIVGHGKSLEADVKLKSAVLFLLPLFCCAAIWKTLQLNRKIHFDIIHAHWAIPGGFLAWIISWLTHLPFIASLHGSDVYLMQKNRLWRKAGLAALYEAQTVTSCSDDLLLRVQGMGVKGGSVVPSCVDTKRFQYKENQYLQETMGIKPGQPVIGTLGRLVSKKGFEYLIEAMPSILETLPNTVCIIGGKGDLIVELENLANHLGIKDSVLFPGHIRWDETPLFYSGCDVIAIPSVIDNHGNVDGLPNVLVEAMSCSRPIVATTAGGMPTILKASEGGLLVPEADAKSLADAILQVLLDKQLGMQLAQNAYNYSKEYLSCEQIAKKFIEIYEKAII